MNTIVQISLDLTSIPEAIETAQLALRSGVDWLEAGTPLIIAEGMNGVRALRAEFPGVPIVADLKTMDGGWLEAQMMANAGATHIVVMERAHPETIKMVGAGHVHCSPPSAALRGAVGSGPPTAAVVSTEGSSVLLDIGRPADMGPGSEFTTLAESNGARGGQGERVARARTLPSNRGFFPRQRAREGHCGTHQMGAGGTAYAELLCGEQQPGRRGD
jgi:uncharacterized low-complexity protein